MTELVAEAERLRKLVLAVYSGPSCSSIDVARGMGWTKSLRVYDHQSLRNQPGQPHTHFGNLGTPESYVGLHADGCPAEEMWAPTPKQMDALADELLERRRQERVSRALASQGRAWVTSSDL